MDVDVQDLDSPPHQTPAEPEHPPLTPDTISDPTSSEKPSKAGPSTLPWAGTAYRRPGPGSPSRPSGT